MKKSDKIKVRPLAEGDIELTRKWRNAYSDKFFDAGFITKDQQRIWYKKYQESNTDKMFIIELLSGEPIGTIALYNINTTERIAELGRVIIINEYRGRGYAEEAVNLILSIADDMRLYKVKVSTHLDNIDAIAVYARCGFKTTTRPIIILERVNFDTHWKEPIHVESYDDADKDVGYESQCTNIK